MLLNIPGDMLALSLKYENINELTEENCRLQIENYVNRLTATHPKVILLNVCYRCSFAESEVMSTPLYDVEIDEDGNPTGKKHIVPASQAEKGFVCELYENAVKIVHRYLLENKIDIYKMAVSCIKKAGCEVWFSFRMSDHHYWMPSSKFLDRNSFMGWDHDAGRVDYSRKAVQNFYKNYIQEMVSKYDLDGIELDWLRTLPVLPKEKMNDYTILNNFVKEIHDTVAAFGPGKHLAIRVLPEISSSLSNGLDIPQWIGDGSIDRITLENFYIPPNYEIPIDEWREAIQKKNKNNHPYELYCGMDWAVACTFDFSHYMTPDLMRGFVNTCIGRGADDVYLMNLCEMEGAPAEMFDAELGKRVNCAEERLKACGQLDEGRRRYVHIRDLDENRYPIKLFPGECREITIYTGKAANEHTLYVGSDCAVELEVTMNGSQMTGGIQLREYPGFEYKENKEKRLEGAPRFYRGEFDASMRCYNTTMESIVLDGYNTYTLKNIDNKTISISWIEVEVV